jgi:deazaflavin-dependent oxidoreductase (nitroreductase family)
VKRGGQRSGPINFLPDGDRYVFVAANWGKKENPGWYYNLRKQPKTAVQVERVALRAEAQESEGEGYLRLWKLVTGRSPYYKRYQAQTKSKIPILILLPGL